MKAKKRAATQRMHLTERRIESLASPKRQIIYDSKVQALGLKLEPTGKKSFFWFRAVAGKPTWKTIGPWPDISLDTARQKTAEYNGKLAEWQKEGSRGPNPFETPRGELTLGELFESYIARHLRPHAHHPEKAEYEIRCVLKKYFTHWQTKPVTAIRRKDVLDLHMDIGERHKPMANKVIEDLRQVINWAIKNELWEGENPCANVPMFHKESRTRFVEPNEMPRLFAALKSEKNPDVVDYVNLSLWTGARKMDVLSMRWSDISLDDNRWLVPDPKNRVPYQIALTSEAVDILKRRRNASQFVFPSYGRTGHLMDLKKPWKALLARAGIQNLRQHDLRRTLGSWQAGQGSSLLVIGKSLGHRSIKSTQIYSQLNLDPVRESVAAATQAMIAAGRKRLTYG